MAKETETAATPEYLSGKCARCGMSAITTDADGKPACAKCSTASPVAPVAPPQPAT